MRLVPWPRRPAQGVVLAIAVAAAVVLAAAALSVATWAGGAAPRPQAGPPPAASAGTSPPPGPAGPAGPGGPPAGSPPPAPPGGQLVAGAGYVASVPASALPGGPASRADLTLVIVSGAPSVTVTAAPLGGTLVRAVTAGGSGARPVLTVVPGPATPGSGQPGASGGQATVGVSLDPAATAPGPAGQPSLALTVSDALTWQLDFGGGTTQTTVNMTGGHVAGLAFGLGAASVQVALPRLDGTVALRLEGGASRLAVSVPAGVPARVTAAAGASQVVLGASTWTGVGAGTVLAQPGWVGAAGRLDIDATSGVSQVTVADR